MWTMIRWAIPLFVCPAGTMLKPAGMYAADAPVMTSAVVKQKEGIVANLEYAQGKWDNYGIYLKLGYSY